MNINVLSLFDGMSCGQIALKELGVEVVNYYASEIDKFARTPEDVYFWREVVTHNVASDCNDYLEEEEWQKAQDALSKITKDQKYYVPEQ